MKVLLVGFLLLALAMCAGHFLALSPGYVLVAYQDWVMETTLWLMLAVVVLLVWVGGGAVRAVRWVLQGPCHTSAWWAKQREARLNAHFQRGFLAFVEGRYQQAEKAWLHAARHLNSAMLSYLGAAQCAQKQHRLDARDAYLRLARNSAPKELLVIDLVRARLQVGEGQYAEACVTLNGLRDRWPQHPQILRLLYEALLPLGRWEALRGLLPLLEKHDVLQASEDLSLIEAVYQHFLKQEGLTTYRDLKALWQEVPARGKQSVILQAAYAEALVHVKEIRRAYRFLSEHLSKAWAPELASVYLALSIQPLERLREVERWLLSLPKQPGYLNLAGELACQAELWSLSEQLYNDSLVLEPSLPAYAGLLRLLRRLGRDVEVEDCLEKMLVLL